MVDNEKEKAVASIDTPTFAQLATMKFGQMLAARSEARQRAQAKQGERTHMRSLLFMRLVLHVAGFGLLTYAGFTISITVGLVVAAASCFLMSTLMTVRAPQQQSVPADPMARR